MADAQKPSNCPRCGLGPLRRSRSQSWLEILRKKYTRKRPYRCRSCNWRGWSVELDPQQTIDGPWGQAVVMREAVDDGPTFSPVERALATDPQDADPDVSDPAKDSWLRELDLDAFDERASDRSDDRRGRTH